MIITEEEVKAIKHMRDDMDAMLGGGDTEADRLWAEKIKIIDNMFKRRAQVSKAQSLGRGKR